jgi:hypothetical protein
MLGTHTRIAASLLVVAGIIVGAFLGMATFALCVIAAPIGEPYWDLAHFLALPVRLSLMVAAAIIAAACIAATTVLLRARIVYKSTCAVLDVIVGIASLAPLLIAATYWSLLLASTHAGIEWLSTAPSWSRLSWWSGILIAGIAFPLCSVVSCPLSRAAAIVRRELVCPL